jgi:hypothetical protein
MKHLIKIREFFTINEKKTIPLTSSEIKYLSKKIDLESKDNLSVDIQKIINTDKDKVYLKPLEFQKILDVLDKDFKNRLFDKENPIENDNFISILDKIKLFMTDLQSKNGGEKPHKLKKKEKIFKKPSKYSTREEIIEYLNNKNCIFDIKSTKEELLKLC